MAILNIIGVGIAGIAVIIPLLFSYIARGWVAKYDSPHYSYDMVPDLSGKVALITGVNTGIGYVTARELARKGAYVVGTVRSKEKGYATRQQLLAELGEIKGALDMMVVDLSSFRSIRSFAEQFFKKKMSLDIVVLNAGIVTVGYEETEDGFEAMIGTNHLGHFLMVKLLQPLFNLVRGCRVVTVSSLAHEYPYEGPGLPFNRFRSNEGFSGRAYSQSKLANILFSNELARRFHGTKVTSNSLHPGSIVTDLFRNFPIPDKLRPILIQLSRVVLMDVDDGAKTQVYVATAKEIEGTTGAYFQPMAKLGKPTAQSQNVSLQKELWDYSDEAVKAFSSPIEAKEEEKTE